LGQWAAGARRQGGTREGVEGPCRTLRARRWTVQPRADNCGSTRDRSTVGVGRALLTGRGERGGGWGMKGGAAGILSGSTLWMTGHPHPCTHLDAGVPTVGMGAGGRAPGRLGAPATALGVVERAEEGNRDSPASSEELAADSPGTGAAGLRLGTAGTGRWGGTGGNPACNYPPRSQCMRGSTHERQQAARSMVGIIRQPRPPSLSPPMHTPHAMPPPTTTTTTTTKSLLTPGHPHPTSYKVAHKAHTERQKDRKTERQKDRTRNHTP
jgi:hypothetical protein